MIARVDFKRFKQFKDATIDLKPGLTLLAGGNNSGKSSILQGLAVWEFCKTVLQMERGPESLRTDSNRQGVGLGDDEFSPVNVPSLAHLWTNLRTQKKDEPDGYTLRIGVQWRSGTREHVLQFGLSLVNDRLFVKTLQSDLTGDEEIPRVAYLPPFSGISDRETRLSGAIRRRLIGQGLPGAVLRNVLLDMYERNQEERQKLRSGRPKIKTTDLAELRRSDPWELLQATLADQFSRGLGIRPFNELYHSYIRVECFKGELQKSRFVKLNGYTPRDIMVEGSGFLQWLSVYALALSHDVDVLLLDEPDAHLHCSLQSLLVERLRAVAQSAGKQVIMATHSTEILKTSPADRVVEVRGGKSSYLTREEQKIGLLAGIGTEYCPKLHSLVRNKRLLILESDRDEKLLRAWAKAAGLFWPQNLVIWPWCARHKERKQLFSQLRREIPDLVCISLRDRDREEYRTTNDKLQDDGQGSEGLICLKWRRREIENYLLIPAAIARSCGASQEAIVQRLASEHLLSLPTSYTDSTVPEVLNEVSGKDIITDLERHFECSAIKIAEEMLPDEICDDVICALNQISQMCQVDAPEIFVEFSEDPPTDVFSGDASNGTPSGALEHDAYGRVRAGSDTEHAATPGPASTLLQCASELPEQ